MNHYIQTIIEALGATLLHSLWQGMIITILLFIILKIFQYKSPQFKYHLSCASLLGLVIWMSSTFISRLNNSHFSMDTSGSVGPNPSEFQVIFQFIPQASSWQENLELYFSSFLDLYASEMVIIWLIGVLLFGLKWAGAFYYTQILKRKYIQPVSQKWQNKVKSLSYDLGIDKTIKIMESTKVDVPMVIGYLKPVILIPTSAFTGFTPQQLESVIVHELAHIKNNDFLINLILSALEVVLFYHPAYWYISKIIMQERENRCDDLAVAHLGNPRLYAETLFNMEKIRQQKSLAMALQGKKNQLLERIKRICIHPNQNYRGKINKSGAAFGLLIIIALVSVFQVPMDAKESILIPLKDEIKEVLNLNVAPPSTPAVIQGDENELEVHFEEENTADIGKLENQYDEKYQVMLDEAPLLSLPPTKNEEVVELKAIEQNISPSIQAENDFNSIPMFQRDSTIPDYADRVMITTLNSDGDTEIVIHDRNMKPTKRVYIEKDKAKFELNGKKLPKGNHTYYLRKGESLSLTGKMKLYDLENDISLDADHSPFESGEFHVKSKGNKDIFMDEEQTIYVKDKDGAEISIEESEDGNVTITKKDKNGKVIEKKVVGPEEEFEYSTELYEKYHGQIEKQREELERAMEMAEEGRARALKDHEKALQDAHKELENAHKEIEKAHKKIEKEHQKIRKENDKFTEELSSELKSDKLIKNKKKFKVKITNTYLKVNGKKQSDSMHKKYMKIFEKHYKTKLSDGNEYSISIS